MATITINAFYTNGVPVGSTNVELNCEGRLPVTAIEERFNAQHGLILDRTDGNLLVADREGYSTRTFTAPGTVTVFLPPKPVEEDFSLTMGFMHNLCNPNDANNKKNS
jgi:hypothetical protein